MAKLMQAGGLSDASSDSKKEGTGRHPPPRQKEKEIKMCKEFRKNHCRKTQSF
jgi:hypothetical protein